MTEVVPTKSQEEYEDDFEKDLDWLISEEGRSGDQVSVSTRQTDCISSLQLSYFFFFLINLLQFFIM